MNSKNYTIVFVFCISLLVCISAVSGAGVDNSLSASSAVDISDTTPSNDADTTIIEKTGNDKKTVKMNSDTSKKGKSIKKNSKENYTINDKTNLNNRIKHEIISEKNFNKINSNVKSSEINNTPKEEFKNKTAKGGGELNGNNFSATQKQVKSIKTGDKMEISTVDVTAEYGTEFILPVNLNPETGDGGVMLYVNQEPMVDEINLTLDPHYFTVSGDKYCPGNYSFWLSFLASSQYDPASDTSHYFTVYGNSSITSDKTTVEVDKRHFETQQLGLTVTADGTDATEYPLYTSDGTVAFYIDDKLVDNSSYSDDYKIDITEDMIKDLDIGTHTWKAVYSYSNEYLRNSSVNGTLNIKGAKDDVYLSTDSEYTTNVNGVVTIPVTFNTTVNEGNLTISYGDSIDYTIDLSKNNPTFSFDTTGYLPGEYNLVINYTGSSNFNGNSTTTTLKIYQPTTITPDQKTVDFEVGKGNTNNIEFTMQTAATGDVITGSIDIYLGDDIIDSINVDSTTATFTLDDDILRGYAQGNYSLKAVFVTGDEYYPESSTTIKLNTYGDVIIDMSPVTVNITDTFKVPLSVTYNEEELTEGTLKYYIDDNPVKTIDLSTQSMDDVVLDTTGLTIGEHTLKVTYDSNVYTATQNHTILTVKSPVNITIDTPNTNINLTTLEITTTDYYKALINRYLEITLPNGTVIKTKTVSGKISVDVPDLSVGENKFTIKSIADDTYNEATVYLTVDVVKLNTTITQTTQRNIYQNTTITVTVKDANTTNTVKDGTLTVIENGKTIGTGTVTNGKADIDLNTLAVGKHNLTLNYSGNDNYNTSTLTFNLEVVGRLSKIETTITNTTVGNISAEVLLTDPVTKKAIPNAPITITLPDSTVKPATTNDNGIAIFNDMDLTVGEKTITVNFAGNDNYNKTGDQKIFTVTKRESTILAGITNNTAGKVTVEATLTDKTTGKPVTDGTVTVTENSVEVGRGSVDANGTATIETDIITKGDHNLVIKYLESTNYTSSSTNLNNINVVGKKSQVDVEVTDDVFNETKVKITVTDPETKEVIPNADMEITLPNGTTVSGKTGSEGTVEIPLDLPVGENKITVTYNGNDTYNSSTTPITFDVKQRESTILAGITNTTAGKVTIQGVITDKNTGKIITSGTVTVTDANDNVVGTGSVGTDGKVTILTDIATKGDYTLTVTYNGNKNYTSSSTTLNNIKVVGKESKVTANITNDTTGTVIQINVTDPETAKGIPDAKVNITLPDGTNITKTTDENGTVNATVDIPAGQGTVNITYLGDDEYEPGNTTVTVSVNKIKTTVVTYAVTANIGNTITLNATVKDADGNPITGGKVAFKINDKTLKDNEGNILFGAVNNGVATITYTIPSDYVSKTYKISTVYSGDNTYDTSRSEAEKLTLKKRTAQLTIISNTTTTKVDETIKLTVNVKDGANTVNGYVIFKVDGKTLTDKNGDEIQIALNGNTATYEYTLPHSMAARAHTFSAVLGNNTYNRVQANTKVTVQKTTTTASLKTTKTSTNTAVLTGTLKDEHDHNLVGTNKVALKLNDVTLKDASNKTIYYYVEDGNVNINFTLPSFPRKGTYKLTLVTGDRYTYTSSKGSTTLTILDDKNFKNIKTYSYKKYVNIYADNTVNNVNTTSSVKLNITDNEKQKISTGTIQFKLNNKTIATSTLNNGVCTFNYKFTTAGTYNIIAYYVENNNYYAAVQKFTVKIIDPRQKVVINICKANHYVNKTATITATVKDTHGNSITTGKALIKINDKEVIRDITNGIIDYTQTFKSLGKYNITVTYMGNNEYYSNTKTSSFTVSKSVPVITIKPVSAVKGIDTDITVFVMDTEGNIINKGIVTLYIDDKQVLKQDISKQVAVYNIKYNRTLKHNIKALYNENTEYTQSTKIITLNVYANRNLYLKTSNINVEKNHEAEIITTVTDNKNTLVNTGKITVKINKKTLKNTAGNIVFSNVLGSKSIITHTFNLPIKKYTMQSIYADENIILRKNSTLVIIR